MSKYNYEDLDFLLNTLYDIAYLEKSKGCYKIEPIERKHIKISDIKMGSLFDSNDILKKGTYQYLGKYNQKQYYIRRAENLQTCMIAIGMYDPKNKIVNDMKRSEIISMAMSYIISEIALTEKLRFVLLPVINFDIKLGELKKKNSTLIEKFNSYDENSMMYINVYEYQNKIITLEN